MITHIDNQANNETKRTGWASSLIHYGPLVLTAVFFICCLVIELLHVEISGATRAQVYSVFGTVSLCLSILLNTAHGRKYGLGWLKSFVFCLASFFLVFNLTSTTWTKVDIAIFGSGAVASFRSIMFLPLLCWILSRFCKVDTWNLCDLLTPYFFFHHGFVTIPCWIQGCCAGKPENWGLVNPLSGMTVFPLQPCIIVLGVAVTYWGLYYGKKHQYQANGMIFANSLIFYGFVRYLLELFSDDPRVFWVLSWLAVCSLAMIVQGFLVRHIVMKHTQTP